MNQPESSSSAVQHRDLYESEVWHGLLLLMPDPASLLAEFLGDRALIISDGLM